jgi:hypothetical protein
MARKLTDEEVGEIRALVAEGGLTYEQIGDRYGIAKSHISRLVHGQQRQTLDSPASPAVPGDVLATVLRELEQLGIDPETNTNAISALVLAERLDATRGSPSAHSVIAAGQAAQRLQVTMEALRADQSGDMPRLASLRGDTARRVLLAIGYPDDEQLDQIDLDGFDALSAMSLQHYRFRHRRPENPGLVAVRAASYASHFPTLQRYLDRVIEQATAAYLAYHGDTKDCVQRALEAQKEDS